MGLSLPRSLRLGLSLTLTTDPEPEPDQARMSMLRAGFPASVPLYTVNRQCSSGLQAVANIAAAIRSGSISTGIAAGVESMSFGGATLWASP